MRNTLIRLSFFLLGAMVAVAAASSSSTELALQSGGSQKKRSAESLLKDKGIETIRGIQDPTYQGRVKEFKAIPLTQLLKGLELNSDNIIVFHCQDGFSASIPAATALSTDHEAAQALLAIESPTKKWPALKSKSGPTAGPYYLIWRNAEKSKIGPEQWPFQVVRIEIKPPLTEQYPMIAPKSSDWSIQRGFSSFQKNCFSCHTINDQGPAHVGPDLNLPFSPTEYINDIYLKRWVRNNQEIRHHPGGKMPAFPVEVLSESELNDLINYLTFMAKNRANN